MERHYEMMRKFREAELSRTLNRARETRSKGYENKVIKEGDLVFYQHQDKKAWLGPVRVFSKQGNSILLFANGSMRKIPRCNVQLWSSEGDKDLPGDKDPTDCSATSPTVNFDEESFGENMTEKDIEETIRRRM